MAAQRLCASLLRIFIFHFRLDGSLVSHFPGGYLNSDLNLPTIISFGHLTIEWRLADKFHSSLVCTNVAYHLIIRHTLNIPFWIKSAAFAHL
jgi:hypothetical protein